ncbi:MAG TPA: sigma-70 family RNA polymerase sigma factor, partial [Gemmataceae bacterium]|nr:sigma-70 family RNA polymerase sigma factor [Gemmataceae bacterium]
MDSFVRRSDEAAFAALVRRHGRLVWGVCWRALRQEQDAEDAFQATFLVLMRRAGSGRWQDSIANWLHETACRVCLRVRAQRAKRSSLERCATVEKETAASSDAAWHELCEVLDNELRRLPNRLRQPLLLCYLEGQTRDQAMRTLGWSLRTLDRRLAEGRELLRKRLTRRGITLPAALLAAGMAADLAPAAARPILTSAAALGKPGHRTVAIAESVLHAMTASTMKTAALFFIVVTVAAAGLGIAAYQGPPTNRENEQSKPAAEERKTERVDVLGDPLPSGVIARLGTIRLRYGHLYPSVVITRDGKTLLASHEDGGVRAWDLTTGRLQYALPAKEREDGVLALSPDGKVLAKAGRSGIQFWDVEKHELLRQFGAHGVTSLAFTSDGKTVVAGGEDGTVRVRDAATGKEQRRMKWHDRRIDRLFVLPDDQGLISVSSHGERVHIANLQTGEEIATIALPGRAEFRSAILTTDGQRLILGGSQLTPGTRKFQPFLAVYDAVTGRPIRELQGAETMIYGAALTPDGKQFVTSEYSGAQRLWDLATGKQVRQWKHPRFVRAVAPDGRTLVMSGRGVAFDLVDLATGKSRLSFEGHQGPASALSFSPDGRTLASCSYMENTIRLWDVAKGRQIRLISGHDGDVDVPGVRAALFLPDGSGVISGGNDSSLRLWDATTGKELRKFALEGRQQVVSMGLSADGRRLMSCSMGFDSEEARYTIFDVTTGKEIARREPKAISEYTAFGQFADGETTIEAVPQGLALIEVVTGKQRRLFQAADRLKRPYALSPDGKWLAARSFVERQ